MDVISNLGDPLEKEEILVVDDQESVRCFLSDLFQSAGWNAWSAASGEEVILGVDHRAPIVALVDLVLPDMNGIDLIKQIKRIRPKTEIILITSHGSLETAIEALQEGAYAYLRKPFESPEEVLKLVQGAIEKRKLVEENERLQRDLKKRNTQLMVSVNRFSSLYVLLWRLTQNLVRQNTEVHSLMDKVKREAVRDTLTDLYNRRFFDSRIEEEITSARRRGRPLAVLLCDLDHFKAINDNLGHQTGDRVLKAVAHSIRKSTRGSDLICRWGGDEFVIALPDATHEGIVMTADRIRKDVIAIGRKAELPLDISIGAALFPEHGDTADLLINLADRALYIAKKEESKLYIGDEECIIDNHSVKVVFQPIVDMRSGQVIGYEALGRDPEGKLNIGRLFKKYQSMGRLVEFKELCFHSQLKQAQRVSMKRVFINVDFNLLNELKSLEKPSGMEVVLEISEAEALNNVENCFKLSESWRERGFKFAIDDFGAGFISFPFICQLVPDYIKMDRSSILQAVASEKFRKFLKDLTVGLQNYSKEGLIAEGIETVEELNVTGEIGISLVQGFLLGKPQELKK